MLRVAILEVEDVAKDIMFELVATLPTQELLFHHYTKISQFASDENEKEFQIIVFHEKFEVPRVTQSFVLNNSRRIILYTKAKLSMSEKEILPFARIFYIKRNAIKQELKRISQAIEFLLKNQEEYLFSYKNVNVPLKITDIYYIEKQDKYLIYHTKRGEFRERKSMKEACAYFAQYHFLWTHVSYLVNLQYVTQIEQDFVVLCKQHLPLARARRADVMAQMRAYVKR